MSKAVLGASRVFATTDGVDKFIKLVSGAFMMQSTTSAASGAQCAKAAGQLQDVRSIMRVGRVFGLSLKLQSLWELFAAQGLASTERKKFVEFFKVIFDLLYAVGDHVLLVVRRGLVGAGTDIVSLTRATKVAQLLSHVLGVVLNLFDLLDAARKLVYDPPAAQRACKIAAVAALRDAADATVSAAILGELHNGWTLSTRNAGALTCLSGALSTYLCWQLTA